MNAPCLIKAIIRIQAVDRLLKYFRNNDLLMGGITVLFSVDFRQILPIIPKGTKIDELRSLFKIFVFME